jgi:hypothetical protein
VQEDFGTCRNHPAVVFHHFGVCQNLPAWRSDVSTSTETFPTYGAMIQRQPKPSCLGAMFWELA